MCDVEKIRSSPDEIFDGDPAQVAEAAAAACKALEARIAFRDGVIAAILSARRVT